MASLQSPPRYEGKAQDTKFCIVGLPVSHKANCRNRTLYQNKNDYCCGITGKV